MSGSIVDAPVVYRKRRNVELVMLVLGLSFGFGAYLLTHLDIDGTIPAQWPWVLGSWVALGLVAHLVVRFRLPYADPLLLPIAVTLTGLGVAMIHRIDLIAEPPRSDARTQLVWVGLGVLAMVAVALAVRDHKVLARIPYITFCVGIGLLLLPIAPLGVELNGSRIWIRLAGLSFQPAEVAKIVLSIAFAGYLAEKRDVLALAGPKILGFTIPRPRDMGPIAVMFGASMLVLVFQRDLGTALLYFGLFIAMLYVATGRGNWVVLGLALMAVGGFAAYQKLHHVQVRISAWLDPFSNFDQNYQVIQAQFGFAWGGLLGRGWGLGRPGLTPLSKSDFIIAAIGEEIGIVGLMAVVVLYGLFVARGLRTALACNDPFGKLLAAGLSFVMAIQVFSIVGGVTRLLPLTGLTTPFMSQGGSSMIANWIVLGLLLVVSHQARKPQPVTASGPIASLSSDATQVISVRERPAPRPEPRAVPDVPSPGASNDATELIARPDAATELIARPDAATELIARPDAAQSTGLPAAPQTAAGGEPTQVVDTAASQPTPVRTEEDR